jgi:hypothetical protein
VSTVATRRRARRARKPRLHLEWYVKGCKCPWCKDYLEQARENGRKGARLQLEYVLQGKYGRCGSCDEPIAPEARLCVICRLPTTTVAYRNCRICGKLFTVHGVRPTRTMCSRECRREDGKARVRNRQNLKRSSVSDITPEQEMAMRKRARKCPLCGVRLTNKPGLPNSKHLDHILPISQGGTHTHGNVRITCRTCNLTRPKDGRDFVGQLTLFAQGPSPVSRPRKPRNTRTCGKGLHPWIPENIAVWKDGKKHCKLCRRANDDRHHPRQQRQCGCGALFAPASQHVRMCPACTDTAARKAAELHATGGLTWDEVAAQVGYGSGWGAAYAARRVGYVPPPRPATPPQPRTCPDCGTPLAPGKGPRDCQPCAEARAWRAVEMRTGGMTLRAIADQLGYDSISSVTNLMNTVVTVGSKMGRPRSDGAYFIEQLKSACSNDSKIAQRPARKGSQQRPRPQSPPPETDKNPSLFEWFEQARRLCLLKYANRPFVTLRSITDGSHLLRMVR